MDAYVETYVDGSKDKYGNELTEESDKMAMMAYYHGHTTEGETTNCLGCHVPTLGEQIHRGYALVTGSYEVAGENKVGQTILEDRELSDLVEARGIAEDEFCLNGDCHHVTEDGKGDHLSRRDLEAATADLDSKSTTRTTRSMASTPAASATRLTASSVNYCTQCHSSAVVPDGWLSTSEAKKVATFKASRTPPRTPVHASCMVRCRRAKGRLRFSA